MTYWQRRSAANRYRRRWDGATPWLFPALFRGQTREDLRQHGLFENRRL